MMPIHRPVLITLFCLLFPVFTGVGEPATTGPKIQFLSVEEAREAFVDESLEPYFSLLNPLEMTAKTGQMIVGESLAEQRDETRRRYREAVRTFSDPEQKAVRWFVEQLHPALAEHYPKFAAQPWRFIKVASHIEGGLPHTRGDQIVFSEFFLAMITDLHQNNRDIGLSRIAPVFIHEQIHVLQRIHPEWFKPLYTEVWGFQSVDEIRIPESLASRAVVNPDGVDLNWVYPIYEGESLRYITPRLVFTEGVVNPRMGVHFQMIAVDVAPSESGYVALEPLQTTPLHGEDKYIPNLRKERLVSIYHPNEIAADLFAHIFATEHLPPNREREQRLAKLHKNAGESHRRFVQIFSATE